MHFLNARWFKITGFSIFKCKVFQPSKVETTIKLKIHKIPEADF